MGFSQAQNIDFVDNYDPEYMLILSGDHIYKMNYSKMLQAHKDNNADATIAVIEVPIKEASRFGIMNTDPETGRIVEFEEKPAEPKSNLASMGIYIFNWKLLRKMLVADMKNEESNHDFGKDIIPALLNDGKRLFAYKFKGVLDTVAHVVAHAPLVIYPRHTERKHPVRDAQAFNKIVTLEFRIFVIHILDGGHHLLNCLQILRFVGKPTAQVVKQFCCFHQTIAN